MRGRCWCLLVSKLVPLDKEGALAHGYIIYLGLKLKRNESPHPSLVIRRSGRERSGSKFHIFGRGAKLREAVRHEMMLR